MKNMEHVLLKSLDNYITLHCAILIAIRTMRVIFHDAICDFYTRD